jgi:fibronectin type III domain protein
MLRVIRLLLPFATVALIASCGKSPVTASSKPSAVPTNGGVQLQWNPVPDQNVTGYRVYYGTASRSYLQPYGQGLASTATALTVTDLAGARRYFFAVTATNSLGKESGYSDEVFADVP